MSCSGLELFGLRFARDLLDRGISVRVACPENSLLWKQCEQRGIPSWAYPEAAKYELVSYPAAYRMLRDLDPCAVIGFRTQVLYPLHAARVLLRQHARLYLFYRTGAGKLFRKDPIHRFLFNQVSAVIPNAEHVRMRMLKYWAIDPEKVVCIRSGIDAKKYHPDETRRKAFRAELGLDESAFVIGNSGRIHPEKGAEILLRSLFDQNGSARNRPEVNLVYVGREYESGYADHLRRVAAQLNAETRFHILPFRNDVEKIYPGFDLFGFAVTSSETYAYVVLEAMASGVPAVVPAVGGMVEMYQDKKEGWFFEHKNEAALRNTLSHILAMSRSEIAATGERARARIIQKASWESMMRVYLDLFAKTGLKIAQTQA